MEALELNRGECLHSEVRWTDENGGPIDLTGRALSIAEASAPQLVAGTVTATDPEGGVAELRMSAELTALLKPGRVNWIRLGMALPDGCTDTTPPIWINVI